MTHYVLSENIMAVAIESDVDGWRAYVGVVDGNNHQLEMPGVAARGTKLNEKEARFFFPDIEGRYAK
jgi:hypothetical protein